MSENEMNSPASRLPDSFTTQLNNMIEEGKELDQTIRDANQADCEARITEEAQTASPVVITNRALKKAESTPAKGKDRTQEVFKAPILRRKQDEGDLSNLADEFSGRDGNREFRLNTTVLKDLMLSDLGLNIHEQSDPAEIVQVIRDRMALNGERDPDPAVVDKIFDFLLEATQKQAAKAKFGDKVRLNTIFTQLRVAKETYLEEHLEEIETAHKILPVVDAVVDTTGYNVSETIDRYRDMVHNPLDIQVLRKYYEEKGYEFMVKELMGWNKYLGRSVKRDNLENPEIAQLASSIRAMQAILGVFRHTKSTFPVLVNYCERHGILAA